MFFFETKKVFIYLWNAFTETLILCYFNPERYICIETDTSGYAISGILSQMALDQLFSNHVIQENHSDFLKSEISQWYPVAFFSRKMILAKTQYKTYDQKLLAIVEAFKTWRYYLKCCK